MYINPVINDCSSDHLMHWLMVGGLNWLPSDLLFSWWWRPQCADPLYVRITFNLCCSCSLRPLLHHCLLVLAAALLQIIPATAVMTNCSRESRVCSDYRINESLSCYHVISLDAETLNVIKSYNWNPTEVTYWRICAFRCHQRCVQPALCFNISPLRWDSASKARLLPQSKLDYSSAPAHRRRRRRRCMTHVAPKDVGFNSALTKKDD